jgi:small subunit ribosomal protein S2
VIEAENEVGLEIIETLQDESSDEDFTSYVDKDEISESEKYGEEEEAVETVAVAAAVGGAAEEQAEAGFTDKDYSDYNPDEEDKKKEHVEGAPAQQVDLADEHNVDEDKLYDE